jgi:hypothetical protein
LLSLEDYRVRSLEAMQAHWCLVFVAYSLLHLACLPPPSKRPGKRPAAPNQSIGAICLQQAQALIQALILFAHDRLQQGRSAATVFQDLFAKQQPEVIA